MERVKNVKSISIWIFIIPFLAVNACLFLSTNLHSLIPDELHQYRIPILFLISMELFQLVEQQDIFQLT